MLRANLHAYNSKQLMFGKVYYKTVEFSHWIQNHAGIIPWRLQNNKKVKVISMKPKYKTKFAISYNYPDHCYKLMII